MSRLSTYVAHARAALPRGGQLPDEIWQRRHRALLLVLVAHVPAVFLFAIVRGYPLWHATVSAGPVFALWLAARTADKRSMKMLLCAAGLITASSMLVHLSSGSIEMHFHFFVMVAFLSLYQDWLPFLTALGLVVFEHGIIGYVFPHAVYNHTSAYRHPWLWALIHGFFVLFASAASVAAWSINEHDHQRVQDELARLQDLREEQLRYQTLHDPLTGLGNRRLLTETLEIALADAQDQPPVALLFVDLDGFKQVNDMFGHDIGDLVLVEVSRRIASAARLTDIATRLGGDEFVVLCVGLVDEEASVLIGRRIERAVAQPIETPWGEVRVTASVGIAYSSQWPHHAEQLLHEADIAMYRAKQLGKDRCQLFDEELRASIANRAHSEAILRGALDSERLLLHYQPIYEVDGRIRGVEALLRVEGADGGFLDTAPLIAVAEETGLIREVTDWVVREACRQVSEWRRGPAPQLVVNVNISGREIGDAALRESVFAALADAGVAPGALALELTETALIDAGGDKIEQLRQFTEAGIHVGMDDFGTGYTSLTQLRQLPLTFIKVDKSFISRLPSHRPDRAIVAALVTLCNELDLHCVAEGVETREQLSRVAELGVGYVQGYVLQRPTSADHVTALLESAVPAPRVRTRQQISA